MRYCGIEIKGDEAIFVLVEKQDNQIVFVSSETKRVTLHHEKSQDSVKMFYSTVSAFFRNNQVCVAAIKTRSKKGDYAGGPTTFKIEGLIQLAQECNVVLLAPATISAANRKHQFQIPDNLHKYQTDAYFVACCIALR